MIRWTLDWPTAERAQVRGQLEVQMRRFVDRLAGFHSASDGDAQTKKRELVHTVLRGLAACIQQQLFGELIAGLQVGDGAIRDIYFHVSTAQSSEPSNGYDGRATSQVTQSTGAMVDLSC